MSLDPFLETIEQRAWIYLKANKPLPDLLTKAITILRIFAPQDVGLEIDEVVVEKTKDIGRFFQEQIGRMSNLRMLILEKRSFTDSCFFSATAACELVLQNDLEG